MTSTSKNPWFSLQRGLLAGLLASGTIFACTQSGGNDSKKSGKTESSKEDDETTQEEETEDSEKEEESQGDEESSSTGDESEGEEESTKDEDSTKEDKSTTTKEKDSTKDEKDSTTKEEDSTKDKDPEPDDGECKVTAQWGDGKPFEAGTHVPNWEMNAVFDHNGDGKIEGDERTAKKITLEDVYCAKPRNKFAVITHSYWT